jgi:hypothetical protein
MFINACKYNMYSYTITHFEMNFSSTAPHQKSFLSKNVLPAVKKVIPIAERVLPVAATFVPALQPVATVVGP